MLCCSEVVHPGVSVTEVTAAAAVVVNVTDSFINVSVPPRLNYGT